MAAERRLLPAAQDELSEAYDWYEARQAGLGEELFICVDECLERIVKMPTMHEVVHKDYRRALIRRFPYAMYYRTDGDAVIVHAVYHTARHPSRWRKRLP